MNTNRFFFNNEHKTFFHFIRLDKHLNRHWINNWRRTLKTYSRRLNWSCYIFWRRCLNLSNYNQYNNRSLNIRNCLIRTSWIIRICIRISSIRRWILIIWISILCKTSDYIIDWISFSTINRIKNSEITNNYKKSSFLTNY